MASTVLLKRSAVVDKVPLDTDLELGELAVNTTDGKLYMKNGAGTVLEITRPRENLLDNPKFYINQRGTFSATPINMVDTEMHAVDRWRGKRFNCTADLSVSAYNNDTKSNVLRIECTSTGNDISFSSQLENLRELRGREVTVTMMVRHTVNKMFLTLRQNNSSYSLQSDSIPSDGLWHEVSVTGTLSSSLAVLSIYIGSFNGSNVNTDIGDYLEIGSAKLELGNMFTGFDAVNAGRDFASCLRYCRISETSGLASELAHTMVTTPTETGTGPYVYGTIY